MEAIKKQIIKDKMIQNKYYNERCKIINSIKRMQMNYKKYINYRNQMNSNKKFISKYSMINRGDNNLSQQMFEEGNFNFDDNDKEKLISYDKDNVKDKAIDCAYLLEERPYLSQKYDYKNFQSFNENSPQDNHRENYFPFNNVSNFQDYENKIANQLYGNNYYQEARNNNFDNDNNSKRQFPPIITSTQKLSDLLKGKNYDFPPLSNCKNFQGDINFINQNESAKINSMSSKFYGNNNIRNESYQFHPEFINKLDQPINICNSPNSNDYKIIKPRINKENLNVSTNYNSNLLASNLNDQYNTKASNPNLHLKRKKNSVNVNVSQLNMSHLKMRNNIEKLNNCKSAKLIPISIKNKNKCVNNTFSRCFSANEMKCKNFDLKGLKKFFSNLAGLLQRKEDCLMNENPLNQNYHNYNKNKKFCTMNENEKIEQYLLPKVKNFR